jgi:hypothetical protein
MKTKLSFWDTVWLYSSDIPLSQKRVMFCMKKSTLERYMTAERFQKRRDFVALHSAKEIAGILENWSLVPLDSDDGEPVRRMHLTLADVNYILKSHRSDQDLGDAFNVPVEHITKTRAWKSSNPARRLAAKVPEAELFRIMRRYSPRPLEPTKKIIDRRPDYTKSISCLPFNRLPEVYGREALQCG